MLEKIAKGYGIELKRWSFLGKGYRNRNYLLTDLAGKKYNLIIYKPEKDILPKIRAAHIFSQGIDQNVSFEVRKPISKKLFQLGKSYGAIYSFLEGETIPWESYTMERIKNLGGALAEIHSCKLSEFANKLPSANLLQREELAKMTNYFVSSDVRKAMKKKLAVELNLERLRGFSSLIDGLESLDSYPLHLDFVRGNVLFSQEQVVGVIDFEKAAIGPRVLDISRTLAFLLVDCVYKPPRKVWRYFLSSGYCKRGSNSISALEEQLISQLVYFYLSYDFYKFLKNNPYESLPENAHFLRTKALLSGRILRGKN
ncbi:MAG: phosphotransferase [Candidatus Dojkabacteria bacterium]